MLLILSSSSSLLLQWWEGRYLYLCSDISVPHLGVDALSPLRHTHTTACSQRSQCASFPVTHWRLLLTRNTLSASSVLLPMHLPELMLLFKPWIELLLWPEPLPCKPHKRSFSFHYQLCGPQHKKDVALLEWIQRRSMRMLRGAHPL